MYLKIPNQKEAQVIIILIYLTSVGLHLTDMLRWQYGVSPDYAFLIWVTWIPIITIVSLIGLGALLTKIFIIKLLGPFLMVIGVIYLTVENPMPGWPIMVPRIIYSALILGIIVLLIWQEWLKVTNSNKFNNNDEA